MKLYIRLLESFSSSKAPRNFLGVTTLKTFLANCSPTPCLLKIIDSCVESLQPQCYWQLTIDQAYFFFRYQFTKLLRTDLSLLGLVRNGWTCFIVTFWLNLKNSFELEMWFNMFAWYVEFRYFSQGWISKGGILRFVLYFSFMLILP